MNMSQNRNTPAAKRPWGERLSSYICPIMLGTAISYAIVYVIYKPDALRMAILSAIMQFLLFMFFDKLKSMTLGGAIYFCVLMMVLMYSLHLFYRGTWTGISPIDWFYGSNGANGFHPTYMRSLAIGGGFFLASILYYYTQVRYRSLGVMLCTLFPFVLYAKRGDIMPEIIITLIITLFLAVMVHNRRIDPAQDKIKRGRLIIDRAYIMSFAVFISVTGAVAMLVKKPTYRSQLEKSADFFDNLLFGNAGTSGYESLSRSSSTRKGGFGYNSSPLFYLEDDGKKDEYYLRRQVYDSFNGDVWDTTNPYYHRYDPFSATSPEYGTDDLLDDMTELAALEPSVTVPDTERLYEVKNIRVYDPNFMSVYLPAPYGVITDKELPSQLKYFKYPPASTIYRVRSWADTPKPLDDSFDYVEVKGSLYNYARDLALTNDEYYAMLKRNSDSEAAQRLAVDLETAFDNYSDTSGVSQRLADLAAQITADCKSDLEKAQALERYFAQNDYYYSTEFTPSDNSIDYFVFESKTGYCAGYATAMTLMARSVGLPARYVEGFAAFERTDDGAIIVREGHAHAFVEAYIPGTGWLVFDPTVPDYRYIAEGTGNFNAGFLFYFIFWLSRFFIVVIVAFFIVFVLLFDRIKERIFRIMLLFAPTRKKVLMLYANLIRLVNFSTKDNYSAYTVKMLGEYLENDRGTVPEKLLELFEKTAFGGYEPTKAEFAEAYKEYKKCYKYMRKIPKKHNKIKTA